MAEKDNEKVSPDASNQGGSYDDAVERGCMTLWALIFDVMKRYNDYMSQHERKDDETEVQK